ncbi:uncharacterized protein LOC115631815 [Scaptodrosophila lebanonensis]|uniref:Uncharacterized protein LOC115631815 n=1 Tax=Drosophila lebanonensis TaxID=7225 RepID=A0A6J2U7L3_DROLE|nr:uncharacterized protein LOC115631815 [Scaptodrosophila lebanonensis]
MSCCPNQEICCGCSTSPQPVAVFRKLQQPLVYDALGPYPDEALMSALDRILYYAGATKILRMLDLAKLAPSNETGNCSSVTSVGCPPPACSAQATSSCSVCSLFCAKDKSSGCTPKSKPKCAVPCVSRGCGSSTLSVCNTKPPCLKPSVTKCSPPPRQRTPRVDFANPVDMCPKTKRSDGGGPSFTDRMKRSLSMCSMAVRRLKSKVTSRCEPRADGQRWLWTRMVCQDNGCKVYEVYKDSDSSKAPCEKEGSPVIIFLVMPNGYIMPFESLSHC